MYITVRRMTFIIITLLAMVGQSLLGNGHAMVMEPDAMTQMHTSASHTLSMKAISVQMPSLSETPKMSASANDDGCHESTPQMTGNCCDTQSLPNVQHCCDGNQACQADCNHCQTINVTANLLTIASWPEHFASETAMATPLPHFHSVALTGALRPPIV